MSGKRYPPPNIPLLPAKGPPKYHSGLYRPQKNQPDRKMSSGPQTIKSYRKRPRKSTADPVIQQLRSNNRANRRLIKDEQRIDNIRTKIRLAHSNTERKIDAFVNSERHKYQARVNKLNSQLVFLSIPHPERDYAGQRAARKVAADANKVIRSESKARSTLRSQAAMAKRAASTASKQDRHLVTALEAKALRIADPSIRSGRYISKERFAHLAALTHLETFRFT